MCKVRKVLAVTENLQSRAVPGWGREGAGVGGKKLEKRTLVIVAEQRGSMGEGSQRTAPHVVSVGKVTELTDG